jgi:7-carboxy-7-deazaguanine synthase
MRVSEVYASVQGEGPRTGQTTVFVRFGGCNLRCPGWPCDTQHAIDPQYRNEWEKLTPLELAVKVKETADAAGAEMITFTGGEPFLQNKEEFRLLHSFLHAQGLELEAFTNGTIPYPVWAVANVSMIMDWKLPGSGEDTLNGVRLLNLKKLIMSSREHAVKFVIKDVADLTQAVRHWLNYLAGEDIITYYGKVWEGELSDAQLVETVMLNKLPWRLNVQLHNYIWDPQERGR